MTGTRELAFEFQPALFARGPHAQMIIAHALMQQEEPEGGVVRRVPLPDGEQLAIIENQPASAAAGGVLLLHGLGGSASAKYMISAAHRLLEAGFAVYRMNHRGAGQGAKLVRRMYHAGLSGDIARAVSFLATLYPSQRFALIGFSMSGNTLLKFLAENNDPALPVQGAAAMNPAFDLSRCMKSVELPGNYFYHRRFTKLLCHQRLANEAAEGTRALQKILSSVRSIRSFDTLITAPAWGFKSAEHYYQSQSALPLLGRIACPTTIITAEDDPMVPSAMFREVSWPDSVSLHITRGGGHMGYLSAIKTPLGDRRFQDYFLVETVRSFF